MVRIMWDNVNGDMNSNFEIQHHDDTMIRFPYDITSVMQYGKTVSHGYTIENMCIES